MAGNGQQGATASSSNLTDIVKSYYPDMLTSSYTVPPIHFNCVRRINATAPGTEQPVLVQSPDMQHEHNIQTDFTQQHVLTNLGQFAESRPEVMFIISELKFRNYLNRELTEDTNTLPNPDPDPLSKGQRRHRVAGDFDIFIIHRKYGILAGEIKSTGWTKPKHSCQPSEVKLQEPGGPGGPFKLEYEQIQKQRDCQRSKIQNKKTRKRENPERLAAMQNVEDEIDTVVISKAIRQITKSEKKAKGMAPGLTVRTTMILPYVSSDQLKRVLDSKHHSQLRQNLLNALKATSTDEAVKLCLLSDQLSHLETPWDVTPDVLSKLGAWWDLRMACTEDPLLTDQSYLDFVAKLVGPATTIIVQSDSQPRIEVRTVGVAAAELARRLVRFVLTPEQVGLMDRNPRLICLTGPPGTGKTVVMELQGLRWLLEGRNVHLVSTSHTSQAINIHIEHQLNMMVSKPQSQTRTPGTVHRHEYDFYQNADYETAVEELLACVKDGTLHILMDEANFTESANDGKRNRMLVTELIAHGIPGLRIWAARIGNRDVPPGLVKTELTLPLRSAPSVLREVKKALWVYYDITKYSNDGVPSPADGMEVMPLSHHGDGHNGLWPDECELCGQKVAAKLRSLHVGVTGRMVDTCPDPLRYGDVFVLTRSLDLHDDVTDKKGKAIPASGFVRGLRGAGAGVDLPVCVLGRPDFKHDRARWERDMADVAVGKMDKVTVAYSTDVQGLERPLVVWLHGRRKGSDNTKSEDWIVAQDRLVAASRAMAQLIVVEVPGESEATHNDVNASQATATDVTPTDVIAAVATNTDVTSETTPTDVTTSEATPSEVTTSGTTLTDVTNQETTVVDVPVEPDVNISEVTSTIITPTDVTATIPTTTDVTTEASPTDVTPFEATPSDLITSDASPTDVPCCSVFSRLFFSRCCFKHYHVNTS